MATENPYKMQLTLGGGLLVFIGILAIPVSYPLFQRPRLATCWATDDALRPAAAGALECRIDGKMPARRLTAVPVVKPRREGRNSHNDATLVFVDGLQVSTADYPVGQTANVNNAFVAASVGGPSIDVPLEDKRALALLVLALPIGIGLIASARPVRAQRA